MKQQKTNTVQSDSTVASATIGQDLKNSVLIVSVIANLYIFTAWVALQVTAQYDNQIASFLFTR